MKTLVVIPGACRGCERCVLWCSFAKYGTHVPSRARIQIVKHDLDGHIVDQPVICLQCGLCMTACPTGAMRRNKAGAVVVDEEKCTGCGLCVMACPYGAVRLDPVTGKAIKCDLCGGEPVCVKHCPFGALAFVELDRAVDLRQLAVTGGV